MKSIYICYLCRIRDHRLHKFCTNSA